jgi:hypothetical protein
LRSRAGSIDTIASAALKQADKQRAHVPNPEEFRFIGIAFASVRDLRLGQPDFTCDVLFDPTCRDGAHANFVIGNQAPEYLREQAVRARLVTMFSAVSADDISKGLYKNF